MFIGISKVSPTNQESIEIQVTLLPGASCARYRRTRGGERAPVATTTPGRELDIRERRGLLRGAEAPEDPLLWDGGKPQKTQNTKKLSRARAPSPGLLRAEAMLMKRTVEMMAWAEPVLSSASAFVVLLVATGAFDGGGGSRDRAGLPLPSFWAQFPTPRAECIGWKHARSLLKQGLRDHQRQRPEREALGQGRSFFCVCNFRSNARGYGTCGAGRRRMRLFMRADVPGRCARDDILVGYISHRLRSVPCLVPPPRFVGAASRPRGRRYTTPPPGTWPLLGAMASPSTRSLRSSWACGELALGSR